MTTKTELTAQIDAFEQHYSYNTTYMREMLEGSLDAYLAFSQSSALSGFRESLSKPEHWLCKLTAMKAEDCGECLQLTIDMALEDGIEPRLAEAIFKNGEGLTDEEYDLYAFTLSVTSRGDTFPLQTQRVHAKYTQQQVLEMGLAIASVKLYPTVKRALGYAKSCQRMTFRVAS